MDSRFHGDCTREFKKARCNPVETFDTDFELDRIIQGDYLRGRMNPPMSHSEHSASDQENCNSFWYLISTFKRGVFEIQSGDVDTREWGKCQNDPSYFESDLQAIGLQNDVVQGQVLQGEVSSPRESVSTESSNCDKTKRIEGVSDLTESTEAQAQELVLNAQHRTIMEKWRPVRGGTGYRKMLRVVNHESDVTSARAQFVERNHDHSSRNMFKLDFAVNGNATDTCPSERISRDPREMQSILDFAPKDEESPSQGKLLCPGCEKLKPRLFYYLQARDKICNACNQHWRRHMHDCPLCNRLKAMMAVESKRGISLQKFT